MKACSHIEHQLLIIAHNHSIPRPPFVSPIDLYIGLLCVGGLVTRSPRLLSLETFLLALNCPGIYGICEAPRFIDYVLCLKRVTKCPDLSVQISLICSGEEHRILQTPIQVSTYPIYFVRYIIQVHVIKRSLLDIKYHVKGCLLYLKGLKGLFCGLFAFEFAHWKSCPSEIGLNGVNVVFPAMIPPLKLVYAKS